MKPYLPFLLLLICGWKWQAHSNLAEASYHKLPEGIKEKLNLTLIKEGSIAPDKIFKDNRNHHYPPSLKLTQEWLEKAKDSYAKGDYNEASYAFGVASHYITDSFVAAHNIKKESSQLHSLFEQQANNYSAKTSCNTSSFNLNDELWQAAKQGHQDWFLWLPTHNSRIPKQEFERAQALLYKVTMKTFNTTCREEPIVLKRSFLERVKEFIAA